MHTPDAKMTTPSRWSERNGVRYCGWTLQHQFAPSAIGAQVPMPVVATIGCDDPALLCRAATCRRSP